MFARIVGEPVGVPESYRGKRLVKVMVAATTTGHQLVTVKLFQTGAGAVHCSFSAPNGAGHGEAGGGNYHIASAALQEAIRSAGYELFGDVYGDTITRKRALIGGHGDGAMRVAVEAVARVNVDGSRLRGKIIVWAVD